MSFKFIQEDGRGDAYHESKNEPVEMEVDSEQFPLNDITDFDTYMKLKPPERGEKVKGVKVKAVVDKSPTKRDYTRHTLQAVEELKIARRTTYDWYKKDQEAVIRNQANRDLAQATVSEAVESSTTQFMGLKIAKAAVHDFMTNECVLTIKYAHFEPKERNSLDSITA
ncbi:hypothetical protein G6F43_011658 [Rhizopus delemar]|nr:hypothetical protein G6F43_011658 [Rhizopus delemar]